MKVFKSRKDNVLYLLFRIVEPVFDPIKFIFGLYGYLWYFRDAILYKKLDGNSKIFNSNIFPQLHNKKSFTEFDAQYFHQQIWAFEKVIHNKPKQHVDVASSYELSGYLSKIVLTKFVDIRPIDTQLDNLSIINGNILDLPFADNELESISCLHVVEHIGLGRYGDEINPEGMRMACSELSRVLMPSGKLYISTPIGLDRLCFNAHRVTSVKNLLKMFPDLKLISFSVVDDNRKFIKKANLNKSNKYNYACGMFEFTK